MSETAFRQWDQVASIENSANIIIGQGLAGSAIAWQLHWNGESVLLVDAGYTQTASRVAAGLVTPITGKRLVKSAGYAEQWNTAAIFYRRVQAETGRQFFTEQPMFRLFANDQSRSEYLQRSLEHGHVTTSEISLQNSGAIHPSIEIGPAGRLDVKTYLSATRKYFESRDCFRQEEVSAANPDQVLAQLGLKQDNHTAYRLILATGTQVSRFFPGIPNNPSQGEVLVVSIPDYIQTQVVHRSIWIAPEPDGGQTVGSTYKWKDPDGQPTDSGRDEILHKLKRLVDGRITVHQHTAGVRPTMKDYELVVGRHPEHTSVFILNGLGSKGVLRAPAAALELMALMQGQSISSKRDYRRLTDKGTQSRRPLTTIAQQMVLDVLQPGDAAVDATVGNGFDTCFLAETVGVEGTVVGFDVQQSALDATRNRLHANKLQNVRLYRTGHEQIAELVDPCSVAAVMFNLGYLPRSDHSIITTAETTRRAIEGALKVLQPSGIMTVLCYRGHDGGQEEFETVDQLLSADTSRYHLRRIDSTPAKSSSPVLFVVRPAENLTH